MKVQLIAICDGRSHWSRRPGRLVEVVELQISYLDDETNFGELYAYFNTETRDVYKDGLIYTDKGWIKEFRKQLLTIGFSENAVNDVDYSEQGMQEDYFVSLDFGKIFYTDWKKLYGPHED